MDAVFDTPEDVPQDVSWGLRLIVPGGSTGLPVFCDPPPPHDCAALDPAVAGAGARLLLGSGLSYLSYGGLAGAWGGGAAQWSGSPSLCSQAGNLVRGRTGSTDDGGGGGSGTITWTCDRVGAGSAASCEPLGVWRESGSEGQRACGPQAGTAGQPQRLSASQPSAGGGRHSLPGGMATCPHQPPAQLLRAGHPSRA